MDVAAFLDAIQKMPWYMEQIAYSEDVPARDASYGVLDRPLDPRLESALADAGINKLYTHQTDAINALRSGKNVIVSTATASGKSLCYNLPVLEALLQDRSAGAMYLFPTKALAQDQRKAVGRLIPKSARLRYDIFDGDTPRHERSGIRRSSRLLITNPDMLHVGILPHHKLWYQRLRSLKYIVIDEAHIYRGVFGSHVANVIRRLRRICQRLGSNPQFVLCSATIANAGEHAERLTGLPFEVVDDDGAPYGGKDFLFWNPPMLDLATGSRRSTNTESAQLFAELLRRYVRTMTFVRSRRAAELLYVYVRDNLRLSNPEVAKRVMPYRASYLPEDRRAIERDLAQGRLLGVTTTTAMELGIDIGDLDATLLTGYPGTIASAWQQAGRSGRSGHRSLSVLVAHDN
ncbi:MAG: DEAD/DEAH box helicase, partial [Chloroflexi bacterium]|nr:DEAD/DEAH box helicase [Chloroflexota bacterium]